SLRTSSSEHAPNLQGSHCVPPAARNAPGTPRSMFAPVVPLNVRLFRVAAISGPRAPPSPRVTSPPWHGQGDAVHAEGDEFRKPTLRPSPSGKEVMQVAPGSQPVSSMHAVSGGLLQARCTKATLLHTSATPLSEARGTAPGRVVSIRAPDCWFRAT